MLEIPGKQIIHSLSCSDGDVKGVILAASGYSLFCNESFREEEGVIRRG